MTGPVARGTDHEVASLVRTGLVRPPPRRLVLVGSAIVDVVVCVEALPDVGGDVVASRSLLRAGGGYTVLSAASRQGLPAVYAGRHGEGPFGDLVRTAMASDDIGLLLPPTVGEDTGFCVAMVDGTGERTFVTAMGTEAGLTPEQLADVAVRPADAVYVSGYDLVYPHGGAVSRWVADLPNDVLVILDPGPLVDRIPGPVLENVLAHASWVSLNTREARLISGGADGTEVLAILSRWAPGLDGVVVRRGAAGCEVLAPGQNPVAVPAPVASVVDTSGAGDVHVGAFLAALGRGHDPVQAAEAANQAAAVAVGRLGPATGPRLDDPPG